MKKMIRTARCAAIALVLALAAAAPAAAAPAAAATPPTRTVSGLEGFVYAAGTACANFEVAGEPDAGFIAKTDFGGGWRLFSVRARGAYVNLTTGKRYQTLDTYRDYGRFDAATKIVTAVETGQTTWSFLPGDQGPYGVVGQGGALYHFIGTVSYTYDYNTFHATSFSWTGTVEDICARLS